VVLGLGTVGMPSYFVVRAAFFPPRFAVPSIALASHYQDPALLDRAFALPVAASFGRNLAYQTNGSVCGPASLANVRRSLGDPGSTQASILEGSGICRTGICFGGLTLDTLANLARRQPGWQVSVLRDLSLEQLREHLRQSNDPARRYIANFQRGLLFGRGTGHHSPIGGYLPERDLVLVLDVNRAFGPWLVTSERLHRAMDSVDTSSGKKRGLLLISRASGRSR
jgi:hypothetical protein